jgi:hypothetical protein
LTGNGGEREVELQRKIELERERVKLGMSNVGKKGRRGAIEKGRRKLRGRGRLRRLPELTEMTRKLEF